MHIIDGFSAMGSNADIIAMEYKATLNYRVELEVMGRQPGEPCSKANVIWLGEDYTRDEEDADPDCYACTVCGWRQKGADCLPGMHKPHMYRAHDYASSMLCAGEMEERLAALDDAAGSAQDQPSSRYPVLLLEVVNGGAGMWANGLYTGGSALLYLMLRATPLQRCEAALQACARPAGRTMTSGMGAGWAL